MQIIDGEQVPIEMARDATLQENDDAIVIERIISEVEQSQNFVFYSIHQEVDIYLDDEKVYSLVCPEKMEFFGSTGRLWVNIPINTHDIGKTLRLEFDSNFKSYENVPYNFYYIKADSINALQSRYTLLANSMALAIIALAIASYIKAVIWRSDKLRKYFFSMADLYLFSGLWIYAECNPMCASVEGSTFSSLLAMIFIRFIPIGFYQFLSSAISVKLKWMKAISKMAWLNLIISMALQLFGVSLVQTLQYTVFVILACCLICLGGMTYQRWGQRYMHPYDYAFYSTIILLIGTLVEVYCYFNNESMGHLNGLFVSGACCIYAIIVQTLLIRDEAAVYAEKRDLEDKYNNLERKPLNQQINAHFLFNTLNTISAYCKESPAKADEAVNSLAQYMRRYMNLVDCEDYVSFEDELCLVGVYLNIENMRYEEGVKLELNLQCRDFRLPPLTLQPLVENVVLHGLHNYKREGVISIKTKTYGEMVELIISDNGKGFNYDKKVDNKGVGITNLNKRIKAMGGALEIESVIDKGTDIILRIPLNPAGYKGEVLEDETNLCR